MTFYARHISPHSPAHQIDSERFGLTLCGKALGELDELRPEDAKLHVTCKACARIAAARARRRVLSVALLPGFLSFGGGAA